MNPALHTAATPIDFGAVFEASSTPFLLVLPDDPVFTIVGASDSYVRVSGVPREGLLGRGVFQVFPDNPDSPGISGVSNLRASFQRAIATLAPDLMALQRYDVERPAAQGSGFEQRFWKVLNTPISGAGGRLQCILHSVEEVTDRVRSERPESIAIQAFRSKEKPFRDLGEPGTFGLLIGDLKGGLSYVNPTLRELLGYTEQEVAAGLVRWDRLTPPEFAALDAEALRQLALTGRCLPYEKVYVAKDGRQVPVLIAASLLEPLNNRTEFAAFVLDLTGRKQSEALLRQQWHTFDTALSHTPDFTYIFDLEGRFTYVNRALLSLWQKTLEQAAGKNFFDLDYPPDLAARLQLQIQEVIHSKAPLRDQTPFTGPTGETGYYEYIFVPVLDENGRVEAVAGSTRDITERRRSEEALRKSEERLSFALSAGGGVGTWDWEIAEDRVYSDARFAQLFSVDPERAAAGAPIALFFDKMHPGDRARVAQKVRTTIDQGADFAEEYRVVQKDGSVRWVYAHGSCQRDEAGRPTRFPGVVFDITERKQAEEALRESEARFRFLAESIPQMVWTATPAGALNYVNDQAASYFGAPRETLHGAGWLAWVHPDEQQSAVERWTQSLATGQPYETSFRLRRGRYGSWRWHLVRALPLFDDGGKVVQWFGTCTDIEDQKATEAELTRANRELEEFAYVASHDLQEPLRMVNIYTQLILKQIGKEDPVLRQYESFVRQGVSRMETLIHDLLTFSRTVHTGEVSVGTADLTLALAEATSVLKNRIEESRAEIAAPILPAVRGDTAHLAHVFQNLLSNSLKYRRKDLPPRIVISAERQGDRWVISVRDNGIGFDQQYAERIFGLFKRLHKDEYPGTGLGLAICHRIIERCGGRMWAEGRPGEGATFFFSLPRIEGQ